MENKQVYIEKNKEAWNLKTSHHVDSEFYELKDFFKGKNVLRSIELGLLGDVSGKRILHLQCHFGMDSLSLARMGADVIGVDLSDQAIAQAQKLNEQLSLNAKFVCCDIYDSPKYIDEQFDIVFTSYGTIGWLPDLDRWAKVIRHFLKPDGHFVMVDFHPFIWTFDDAMKNISYHYFNRETIIEKTSGTYADRSAEIETETHSWNHPISEILTALINNNLAISAFNEYDYSPYNCFQNLEERAVNEYVFQHIKYAIPITYSIVCRG